MTERDPVVLLVEAARSVSPDQARNILTTLTAFHDLTDVQREATLAFLRARASESS